MTEQEIIAKKRNWKKIILIIFLVMVILLTSFFLVTGVVYYYGGYSNPDPVDSPNYYQDPINPNNNSVGFVNRSGSEKVNIDKDEGHIYMRGNLTANFSGGGVGYFNWLGTSANKITNGFFSFLHANYINSTQVNASSNIYINGNEVGKWIYNQTSASGWNISTYGLHPSNLDYEVGIGQVPNPNYALLINRTGGANNYGLYINSKVTEMASGNAGGGIYVPISLDAGDSLYLHQARGIFIDTSLLSGNVSTVFNFRSQIGAGSSATGNITTAYLYYGTYSGEKNDSIKVKWGTFIDQEQKNYFSNLVGIGTKSPRYLLDVNGNASINNTFYVTSDGNVGIGISNPSVQLQMNGSLISGHSQVLTSDYILAFGSFNNIYSSSNYSQVFGQSNTLYGSDHSMVYGSVNNVEDSDYVSIFGAINSINDSYYSTIYGLLNNVSQSSNYSMIVGRDNNIRDSLSSMIIGNNNNINGAENSFIFGSNITSYSNNSVIFSSNKSKAYTINQDNVFAIMDKSVGIGTTTTKGVLTVKSTPIKYPGAFTKKITAVYINATTLYNTGSYSSGVGLNIDANNVNESRGFVSVVPSINNSDISDKQILSFKSQIWSKSSDDSNLILVGFDGQQGVYNNSIIKDSISFSACPATVSSGNGIINNSYAFLAEVGHSGGDSIVMDNWYGLYIEDTSTESTYSVDKSYGIYQLGSDYVNYFNGKVGINTITPSYPLQINASGPGGISIYTSGNVSALGYIDRTPWYDGDALSVLNNFSGDLEGINHSSLGIALSKFVIPKYETKTVVIEKEVCPENDISLLDQDSEIEDKHCRIIFVNEEVNTENIIGTEVVEGRDLSMTVSLLIKGTQELLARIIGIETNVTNLQSEVSRLQQENIYMKKAMCEIKPELKICKIADG